jgi:hypothetical protein
MRHVEATSTRLRINTVLNAVTKRGPFIGNSFAVVGRQRCDKLVLIFPPSSFWTVVSTSNAAPSFFFFVNLLVSNFPFLCVY